MNYKIKLFSGQPDKIEADLNNWLSINQVEVVQLVPALAMNAIPVQATSIPGIKAPMSAVQVQMIQMMAITVLYREKDGD